MSSIVESSHCDEETSKNSRFDERLKLYLDAVNCRPIDRVFMTPLIGALPVFLYGEEMGVSVQDALMNPESCIDLYVRYHEEYQPDLACGPESMLPACAAEIMGTRFARWPGKHMSNPNAMFQIVDTEYMKVDEYEEYIDDPTGFMIRKILPRHHEALESLSMVDLSQAVFHASYYSMIPFALSPVKKALSVMSEAGDVMLGITHTLNEYRKRMELAGWPNNADLVASVPFDLFNDTLRGMTATFYDILECPELLERAVEKSTRIAVRGLKEAMARQKPRTVHFYLHNGTDIFMSRNQFLRFYWPGLKAMVECVAEFGGIAKVVTEDKYDAKLDILATLPKGHTIIQLVNSDLELAKRTFSGKVCFSGGVDASLLAYGTVEQVIENVKETLDICTPGGGYILDVSAALDLGKPENLRAMFETAREYQVR